MHGSKGKGVCLHGSKGKGVSFTLLLAQGHLWEKPSLATFLGPHGGKLDVETWRVGYRSYTVTPYLSLYCLPKDTSRTNLHSPPSGSQGENETLKPGGSASARPGLCGYRSYTAAPYTPLHVTYLSLYCLLKDTSGTNLHSPPSGSPRGKLDVET